jgi:hypothetical protein
LDKELAKYEAWGDLGRNTQMLFDNEHSFYQVKNHGIGITTLKKFMGSNWKEWVIKEGLRNTQKTQKKVVKKLPRIAQNGRKSPS